MSRNLWLAIYTAIAVVGLLITGHSLSRANEVTVGQGLVCDHAVEVADFLRIVKDDPQAAINEVNAKHSPTACVLGVFAFVVGDAGETIRTEEGEWKVTAILVIAVHLPQGWQRIHPTVYFTALRADERGA